MNSNAPLFADVERLSATSAAASDAGPRAIATCDHDVIRQFANSGGRPMGRYHLMRVDRVLTEGWRWLMVAPSQGLSATRPGGPDGHHLSALPTCVSM